MNVCAAETKHMHHTSISGITSTLDATVTGHWHKHSL